MENTKTNKKTFKDTLNKLKEASKNPKEKAYKTLYNFLKPYITSDLLTLKTCENYGVLAESTISHKEKEPAQPKGQPSTGDFEVEMPNGKIERVEFKLVSSRTKANGQRNGSTCKYNIIIFYGVDFVKAQMLEIKKTIYNKNDGKIGFDNLNRGVDIDINELMVNRKVVVKG